MNSISYKMENNSLPIDSLRISDLINSNHSDDGVRIREIISKSKSLEGLDCEDVAYLINVHEEKHLEDIFEAAKSVKQAIYGHRIVLFAPIYISSLCKNNCLYCAFRSENHGAHRRMLSMEEIAEEVQALQKMGHKRLLLVAAESPFPGATDYIFRAIDTVYNAPPQNAIRRVNVNIPPMSASDFKRLKKYNIGTYQLFQETYHRQTYRKMHPSGPKSDYDSRILSVARAMSSGIEDVGIGVLFGLYDYRFELLALLQHAIHLENCFGSGPHTISVPRIEPAQNSSISLRPPSPVTDADFLKIIAILRLAVPYTGIILSTRERPQIRRSTLSLGVSQMSAASCTFPGGYSCKSDSTTAPQFELGDNRSLDEVIFDSLHDNHIPSFCTACYRRGRVGESFMKLAKPGDIKHYCLPNALLSLKEYLVDYASKETQLVGNKAIDRHIEYISDDKLKSRTRFLLSRIEDECRDLYF